ncbi:MAG: protein translocase subunit SecF [Candidatus Pelagibacter sp.]|nr:protein translocase subunit SecF [Candidatus Pelagibacter sp.]|tara:strand:+ start:2574 stop:3482 length:909 start_codon:yes stop_codon:yes gene_type:complete
MINVYNRKLPFLKNYKKFYLASIFLLLISIISIYIKGLNLGIDFKGGTIIEMQFDSPITAEKIRQSLLKQNLGDIKVKEFGNNKTYLAILEKKSGKANFISQIKINLEKKLSKTINFRRVEMVGPKISKELTKSGIYAVLIALILMLFYIWLRFEWQFSLGAILALSHDVILTLGAFSIIEFEFNLSIIAAILTIVGYSMNDTVVIYDRIRENLKKDDKLDLLDLLNNSVNETLPRTLKTSITTLLALVAIYLFGGEILKGFSFALIWGVLVGTYSSIFIASPLMLIFNVKRDWSEVVDNSP